MGKIRDRLLAGAGAKLTGPGWIRRTAWAGAEGAGGLPDGYRLVDYLECTGHNARFDTGVSGNDDTLEIRFAYMALDQSNYAGHFGNYESEDKRCWRIIQGTSSSPRIMLVSAGNRRAGSSMGIYVASAQTGSIIGVKAEYNLSFGRCSVESSDGTTATITPETDTSTASGNNIAIGANRLAGFGGTFRGRFWYFKIWSNGALIRDYVPCVRKSDSKAGFFDLVNRTFNPSIGSAEFIAGTDE